MIGKLADILMMTTPEIYRKYITVNKKWGTVIYVKALNAIYLITKAEVLFYREFFGNITTIDLKLKPQDPFISKYIINGKKNTVVWHVYDIKISHESKKVCARIWIKQDEDL